MRTGTVERIALLLFIASTAYIPYYVTYGSRTDYGLAVAIMFMSAIIYLIVPFLEEKKK